MPISILKGLFTTIKHVTRRPTTYQYPDVPAVVGSRFRGRHFLARYENGLERCVGCELCQVACPADAIHVVAAENTDKERFSPGERYGKVYELDMFRCIFCGLCVDSCPEEAIRMTTHFEMTVFTRRDFTYNRWMLLEDEAGATKNESGWGMDDVGEVPPKWR